MAILLNLVKSSLCNVYIYTCGLIVSIFWKEGNSVVTDVQFGHLFLVCITYDALQEVTCGLFRKISHCS